MMPQDFVSKMKWRGLFYQRLGNRMEMNGTFTADDLRKIADWLDNPEHPVGPFHQIELKLSPITHEE